MSENFGTEKVRLTKTYLTLDEVNLLARGLASLVDPQATPQTAHEASQVVYGHPDQATPFSSIRTMATHLAELSYDLER